MSEYFLNPKNFFMQPSVWGVLVAIAFALLWLALLAPRQATRPTFWVMLVAGAVVFIPAYAFVLTPLQTLLDKALTHLWTMQQLQDHILIAVIPFSLLNGFGSEIAKLVPLAIFFYAVRKGVVGPKSFMLLGAAVGAGFIIFQNYWLGNSIFGHGFTWASLQQGGWDAYMVFFERFFATCLEIACAALVAWGLARKRAWQYYVSVSIAHSAAVYIMYLPQLGKASATATEIGVAVLAALLFASVAYIRWHPSRDVAPPSPEPVSPSEPVATPGPAGA